MSSSVKERIKLRNIFEIVQKSEIKTCDITSNTTFVIKKDTIKYLEQYDLDLEDLVGEIVYRSKIDGKRPRIIIFIGASEETMKEVNGEHQLWNTIQKYIDNKTKNLVVSEICTASKTYLIALVESKFEKLDKIGKEQENA